MGTLLQDIRYGLRVLSKKPAFTALAVVTLALGIGASTATFGVVDAFLLRPLPYPDAERLVVVFDTQPELDDAPAAFLEFADWKQHGQSFEGMTALFHMNFNYVGRQEPERIRGAQVAEGYFDLLGAKPLVGRAFSAAEHQTGAAPVALVSHGLWQRQFGGDPNLVGSSILLNGTGYTVVGVMPPDAPSFSGQNRTEVWTPLESSTTWRDRGTHYLTVLARLRPGVDLEGARAETEALGKRLAEANASPSPHGIRLVTLREHLVGDTRARLLLMLAAVSFVLLIALANVANLLLTRATGRGKEFAIRTALGAGRLRLLRQLLTESVLLALVGGALGVLLAFWATDLIVAGWPANVRRPEQIGVDWRVLSFTASLSVACGVLFGLAPALRASKVNLNESLKESAQHNAGGRGQRTRHLLVVSEIALATVLLLGAGLLLKSFWLLQHTSPGFDPENVLTLQVSLPSARYREPVKRADFFRNVLGRVSALPGVEAAGAVNNLPLTGGSMNGDFRIEGHPPFPRGEEPVCEKYIASPDYFRAMGIALLSGRFFDERDAPGRPEVILINEALARRFFAGEDPVGRRMSWGGDDWRTIVGVVGDVKHEGLDRATAFESYVPLQQVPSSAMAVVVRAAGDPTALVSAVRQEVLALDREQPVHNVRTLSQIVAGSVAGQRLSAVLLGALAAIALVLAAVGIYGVLSYAVSQRTHEIGVRMALGARAGDVLRLVIRQGMGLALVGVAAGLAGAFALTRTMSGLLYGVSATDPATFAGIAALLLGVAFLACYLPARRAAKVDPMVALRYE